MKPNTKAFPAPPIRVVLIEEESKGARGWVAKSLDLNLVAQGTTMQDAKESFQRIVRTHLILCQEADKSPLLKAKANSRPVGRGIRTVDPAIQFLKVQEA
jgi:hypothetical protein